MSWKEILTTELTWLACQAVLPVIQIRAQGGPPLAGGLALKTDFGTFYTPNLTTDKQEGMGDWTVDQFANAVRRGVSPGGEPYYPAFPYPFYSKFSDQDLADLWAAFQTVPADASPSREHALVFPFNIRSGQKLWRAAYLDLEPFEPDPSRSDRWNRGKYITRGAAHCGACHTPRNFAGARQAALALHGADSLPDGGTSPPITAKALIDGGWTVSNLTYALQTGVMPDGDTFGGSMGEVVRDGTQYLTKQDREAIASYLLNKD
ncbi:c-type cytochrome [Martelella lutilitoris]|uniref:c-type cytochrome n=1 Tax=Martelella lutilitoris TaxID=2583532 RepID=UPI001AEE4D00|nr:cytochrome c [Martelella lutilitoris]